MSYKSSPRGARPVRLIVLHTTEGALTAASLGAYFYRPDVAASSHVGIGTDGLKQYVSYSRSAWTVRSGNPVSDNAELCGFAHWTREQWLNDHRKVLDLAADWVKARCLARGIPRRKLTTSQVAAGAAGVIGHWDWTVGMRDGTHTDPGSQFPWDYVMNRAAQGGTVTKPTDNGTASPVRITRFEEDSIMDIPAAPKGGQKILALHPKVQWQITIAPGDSPVQLQHVYNWTANEGHGAGGDLQLAVNPREGETFTVAPGTQKVDFRYASADDFSIMVYPKPD